MEIRGKLILFGGDLLQMPPVIKYMSIPVVRGITIRMSYWDSIHKYVLTTPKRCTVREWSDFLKQIATGKLDKER
jgi:hypothetical protein